MSVSHKKINRLIEEIIGEKGCLEISNKEVEVDLPHFINLCKKIYLIESSTGNLSQNQIIDEIRADIILTASKISGGK